MNRSSLLCFFAPGFASLSLLAGGCDTDADDGFYASQAAISTTVPGHTARSDQDQNRFPDLDVLVTGHYKALYAYDANGDYHFDRGDGRIEGTVPSVDALEQTTLTRCAYVINYRGTFQNDPFLDTGWITNHVKCSGIDATTTYNSLFVHKTDPRYVGNPAHSIWGDWELHVDTTSKFGNWVRPHRAP